MDNKKDELNHKRRQNTKERLYLAEIKQFCNYYMVIADKLKMSYELSNAGEFDELISKEELEQIDKTKDLFNRQYQSLLLDPRQSILPFLDLVLVEVIDNDTVPTNLLKITIKILTKVFKLVDPSTNLMKSHLRTPDGKVQLELYDASYLLQSLMNCQIDDHSNEIDQQELIWISIQKLMLQIIKRLPCSDAVLKQVFGFFQRLLENRGFSHNTEMGQTAHFSEKVKKNMNKLYKFLILERIEQVKPDEDHINSQIAYLTSLKDTIVASMKSIDAPIEMNENQQPVMTQAQKNKENEKMIKQIAFSLTVFEEVLQTVCLEQSTEEFCSFLKSNFNLIVEIVCLCCEQKEKIVQLQAQQLFLFLLQQILLLRLPLREQFEILYVKCALKPIIQRIEHYEQLKKEVVQQSGADEKKDAPKLQLSDDEDEGPDDSDSKKKKVLDAKTVLLQDDCQLSMSLSFLQDVLLSLRPEDIGLLFLIYDCQHFSESIITKSLNLLQRYTKDDGHLKTLMYDTIFKGLRKLDTGSISDNDGQQIHVTHQRLKYMLDQKSNQKSLARLCNQKPKLFLNKCQEIYKFIDDDAPWDIASKILLYSREPIVEHVTEIIGGKEQRNGKIFQQFLQKQDFRDGNLEHSIRRFMQTFRLAGVESQVVLRVMEGFSFEYFNHDKDKVFTDKEEAYEMAYLVIVLQTTMHNPSIKQKLRAQDFIAQAKACCPKSYDQLPENYMNILYENVKAKELYSPISRDWYKLNFNEADLNVCNTKLSQISNGKNTLVDQTQFVNTADLTQKSLFCFNNEIDAIDEGDRKTLILGALRHIVSMLSKRFLKSSIRKTEYEQGVLKKMLELNKSLFNFDFTDRILRSIHLINQSNESLINEIIKNFDMGAKNTVTLIPQIILSKGVRHTSNGTLLNKYGLIDQAQLLEICQASERYFRKKHLLTSQQIQRQILQLEGKTPQQIEEILKKQHGLHGFPGTSPSSTAVESAQQNQQSTASSLVNIVFNYFNEQQDNISGPKDEKDREKYQTLKKHAESIKSRQTDQMKFMNQQFAQLIRTNTAKQYGSNQDFSANSGAFEEQEQQFDQFISSQIGSLLPKILLTLKDNLFKIIKSQDGLFSLLFINNAIKQIMEELEQQRCQKGGQVEDSPQQRTLDTIWQEMHLIMSKLTSTKRKIVYLRRSSQKQSTDSSDRLDTSVQIQDFDDMTSLDSSFRSSDENSLGGSSSSRSNEIDRNNENTEKNEQDVGKKAPEFQNPCTNAAQKRVYQALCKHLILEIFFNINAFQIELISGITNNKVVDMHQQIQKQKLSSSDQGSGDLRRSQGNSSTAISASDTQVAGSTSEGTTKDIQECMREIWRVFKSIVQGPSQASEDVDSDEDIKIQLDGVNSIFDDLHVIIVINKLLQIEQKVETVGDDGQQVQESMLPVNSYNKIYKFLRNLIIHSAATIEEIQMEVYVQNSDAFVTLIGNCLKYIKINSQNQKLVPYDLIGLIIDLISKIAKKSKQMRIEIDVCQFINIFSQLFRILQIQNSYDLWLETMVQYQDVVIFNNSLITAVNWEQTMKHAFLTYKSSITATKLQLYAVDWQGNNDREQPSIDGKLNANLTTVLNRLIFEVSFDSFIQGLQLRQNDLQNDTKIQRLMQICEIFLESSSEILINIVHMLLSAKQQQTDDDQSGDQEMFKLFQSLWFSFLKQQLAYLKRLEPLNGSIKENIKRVLVVLVKEERLYGPRANQEGTRMFKMWKKSWDAIQSFYPNIKDEVLK